MSSGPSKVRSIEPRDLDYEAVLRELQGWCGQQVSATLASHDRYLMTIAGTLQNATNLPPDAAGRPAGAGEVFHFHLHDGQDPPRLAGMFVLDSATFSAATLAIAEPPFAATPVLNITSTSTLPDLPTPPDELREALEELRVVWLQLAGLIRLKVTLLERASP